MLNKLFFIKLVHIVLFFFMVICLGYLLYCGVTRTFNWILILSVIAIIIEGIALLLNNWQCPLTTLAEKHGAESGAVSDLFLPGIITRNIFRVAMIIFPAELVLLAFRYFTGI
ncbi:hypothetical protein ACFLWU_00275 [Chloroflexota bacterium]